MTKILLTAALIGAAILPTVANAAPKRSFVRDGQIYVYTTEQKPGRVVISGRRMPSGSDFRLVVRGAWVTGVSDGVPVSFTVPNAQEKLTAQELASK